VSLRTRILTLTVSATAVVLVLFAIPLVLLLHRVAAEDVQQKALDTARGVADYISTGGADGSLEAYVARVDARDDSVPVAVVTSDGTTYGPDLPGAAELTESPPFTDHDKDGDGQFLPVSQADIDDVNGGRLIRIGVNTADGADVVLAFADDDRATSAATRRLLPLGGAALLLLLLAGGAAELVARRLVRDLNQTADLADTIASGDVVARAPESGPPEVRRVATALNRLAGRIDELLAAERETAADLSHRLRTPLTVLRLDVEALPADRSRAELEEHLDQLERTLTAVIHQARRSQREGARPACDPGPIVEDAAAFWRPLVEDQGRILSVSVTSGLPEVRCAADDLRAAVDALFENCVAHTPEGTAVGVRAARAADGEGVAVEVCDRGPGFSPDAVRRGRSDRGSTGLGLDIARACARASGGDLEVVREAGAGGRWTVVRLTLGEA
jgi:signal transduction histidine kinase